ncbi:MAG: class I SAM-dependent methyltransferase [Anaerosomatales bacterium]|nr:class I SAM-dependent methyltransferase [Anaerosomatales bacterium]
MAYRFNPAKLEKLNDVRRLDDLRPDEMWAAFGVPDARVAVEVGAGTGIFSAEFARRMAGGGVLYAVDSEPAMLDWMAEHLPDDVRGTIAVTDADALSLPLEDGAADLVFSVNLHHELPDRAGMIAEAVRVLRAGGTLGIVDWAAAETPKGPPIEHRIPAETIAAELEAAGLADVTVHPVLPYHSVVTGRKPV